MLYVINTFIFMSLNVPEIKENCHTEIIDLTEMGSVQIFCIVS